MAPDMVSDLCGCAFMEEPSASPSISAPTSIPSPSPTRRAPGPGICFSGEMSVQVKGKGFLSMYDLQLGDEVLTGDDRYEPVYSFGHHQPTQEAHFLQVRLLSSSSKLRHPPLEISRDHMVFVDGKSYPIPASRLKKGDRCILSGNESWATVTEIKQVVRKGVYAPFTVSGTIVVNGVLASSYVGFQDSSVLRLGDINTPLTYQWLAHAFEAPHRLVCLLGWCNTETYTPEGISTWVDLPHQLSLWWVHRQDSTNDHGVDFLGVLLLVPFLAVFGSLWLVERSLSWGMELFRDGFDWAKWSVTMVWWSPPLFWCFFFLLWVEVSLPKF